MSLTASALPPAVRRQVLERLREQMGPSTYRDAVSKLGEDGLITFALMSVNEAAPKKKKRKWLGWVYLIVFVGLFAAVMKYLDPFAQKHTALGLLCGLIGGGLGGGFVGPTMIGQASTVTQVFGGIGGAIGGAFAGWTGADVGVWYGASGGGALAGFLLEAFFAWIDKTMKSMPRF